MAEDHRWSTQSIANSQGAPAGLCPTVPPPPPQRYPAVAGFPTITRSHLLRDLDVGNARRRFVATGRIAHPGGTSIRTTRGSCARWLQCTRFARLHARRSRPETDSFIGRDVRSPRVRLAYRRQEGVGNWIKTTSALVGVAATRFSGFLGRLMERKKAEANCPPDLTQWGEDGYSRNG
jgi:hypothetical protein